MRRGVFCRMRREGKLRSRRPQGVQNLVRGLLLHLVRAPQGTHRLKHNRFPSTTANGVPLAQHPTEHFQPPDNLTRLSQNSYAALFVTPPYFYLFLSGALSGDRRRPLSQPPSTRHPKILFLIQHRS